MHNAYAYGIDNSLKVIIDVSTIHYALCDTFLKLIPKHFDCSVNQKVTVIQK